MLPWKWNCLPQSESGSRVMLHAVSKLCPKLLTWFCNEKKPFLMIPFCYLLQKVSEKVGGAEGTKLDDDFKEMERVSLHFLAFPWHGVVHWKRGVWSCSVLESPSVLFRNKQTKPLSFHCMFWSTNWKAAYLPCPSREQNHCEDEWSWEILSLLFLIRVVCVELCLLLGEVESE